MKKGKIQRVRPILFNGKMVRAIISGRKTTTRRVLMPANMARAAMEGWCQGSYGLWVDESADNLDRCGHVKDYSVSACWMTWQYYTNRYAPYHPGDILYVRETWALTDRSLSDEPGYVYRATDPDWETMEGWKWRPSIHMPKEAARIWLRVTSVRLARLQDMTEEDVIKEGYSKDSGVPAPKLFGEEVWNPTVKKSNIGRYGWDANPWVWVIEFVHLKEFPRR